MDLRAHCSAILVSRLLSVVRIIGFCGFHLSVQVEFENVVFEIHGNEFVSSTGSFNRRHVPSRNMVDLCTRSNHSRRILETAQLHHQESIHHWLFDRIFHLLLHLDRSSMGMCPLQLLCPGSSSPIQTASDYSWHQDQDFQVKVSLRSCHVFVPNLRAIQPNSPSHHSIHHNSSNPSIPAIMKPRKNCQWDTCVQIPEFF